MSYKSENWKEKLEQVRNHIALKEGSVEKTADEILESQIEEELKTFDDIQEVTDKEISAVKKLSKLIEKAKKDYQKIAKMGDKSLQLTGFNEKYESILKAQQEILSLIGDLTTMKMMSDRAQKNEEVVEEEVIDEKIKGTGEAISKIFKTKDKKEIDGIANLMNMTSVKVLQSMMKQNPKGFKRMAAKMGELPAMEEVEVEESVEKTTEKLVERNMLGRLAKQLKLNEEGKQKMFAYFEKGELNQ
tara:strand:+ start:3105 stop:3839 length:735 start_codon:yes stop_codon:yes gene_type:complete